MKGFPAYQNKIWKWDFAPTGDRSATRKGWRLFAYVPDPDAPEPIPAKAFFIYDKSEVLENKNYPKFLAARLREFLSVTIPKEISEDRFRHQTDQEGRIISLCCDCFETIAISTNQLEIDSLEANHDCKKEEAENSS
jgi:hypothetical protein